MSSPAPANVGRKRLYNPTSIIYGSPARPGHASRMAGIFRSAATSLSASPNRAVRQESSAESDATLVPAHDIGAFTYAEVVYPKLQRLTESASPRKTTFDLLSVTPGSTWAHHSSLVLTGLHQEPEPQSTETVKPQMQYSVLGRPGPLHFPRVDSAVSGRDDDEEGKTEEGEEEESETSATSSTSSASWTGDSQFFRRSKPKRLVLPVHERECGVSKWLERLPTDFPEPEEEDCTLEPLSPSVELSRGSMRRKQREWERLERLDAVDDADSFIH